MIDFFIGQHRELKSIIALTLKSKIITHQKRPNL